MLKYIIEGIKIVRKEKIVDVGIFYRLYGVYYFIRDEFKIVELLFKKFIELFLEFEWIGDKNFISIVVNYNYIGEIRNFEGNFEEVMEFFNKVIKLCENYEVFCFFIFYINVGKISYLIGNF